MQTKSYTETLDWLFEQFPSYQNIGASAYKPDLGNIKELCELMENPQDSLKFIHIAGTNGKGSTSSMLASILTEHGERTGLFTSPHISDFRERIRVNGKMISEEQVVSFCNKIQSKNLPIEPSFFEITFAMALDHFKKEKCSICVIETGLGGRLDATNIITPIVSVITNISLEHTQFLGNTLESIAFEKAGIIKPGVPVVIGETVPETKTTFETVAASKKSKIIFCEEISSGCEKFELPLLGSYQQKNLNTVLHTIQILTHEGYHIPIEEIQNGLNNLYKNTGFFGRMQIIKDNPLTILDVSHNSDGIKQTLSAIKELNKGELHLIYGSSSDKNYEEIIALFPPSAHLNFCTFRNSRSLSYTVFEDISKNFAPKPRIFHNVTEAILTTQELANKEDTILVFGSFFLISDFF